MANPAFEESSLPRRKQPAEALTGKDTTLPVQEVGIYNATPPALSDGDFALPQIDDLANKLVALGDPAQVALLSNLNPFGVPAFDYVALTYVAAGNGAGEVETAIYKTGGSGGTTVATLTLAYTSNVLQSVTKS